MSMHKLAVKNLLAIIAAYRKITGHSMATCSQKFYKDARFFDRLKNGDGSLTFRKMDEVLKAIRKAWPPGAEWPMTRALLMNQRPTER